jgi:Kef-type K+ transport system membrane component KefB
MAVTAPIPPLAGQPLLTFLLALVLLLLLARLLGRLAERIGLPAVVGELLTGVILGPSLLGHVAPQLSSWLLPNQPEQVHLLDAVAQFGVLLLVGITMSDRHPQRWIFALFLGVAMCVSAIPVIAKTLSDMRLLHRNIGQLTLAAGMIDDAVGWFLLTIVSAAASVGVSPGRTSLSVLYLIGFVVLAATAGRPLVRRVMRLAARSADPGPTVATTVIIVLLGAVATHALGMEPIFGAFVAGILVGAPKAADQTKLAPLRTVVLSVLSPIFLAAAGLRMDLTALAHPVVALAAAAVLAIAILGKFAGAYLGARLSRLTRWEGFALGAGMNARGVVEVIVALTGLRLGVLNTATYTIVVLVAIVTSLMAPPLLRAAMTKVAQSDEERLRKIDHDVWSGTRP